MGKVVILWKKHKITVIWLFFEEPKNNVDYTYVRYVLSISQILGLIRTI